jgi:hydroxymethylpyrimidine pyrophosphatase-like HAD family hydrolase
MIKLFVVDLDGCISHPFQTPDWEAINVIRNLNIASANDPSIPGLTICTGRPLPYAEAVAQWLCVEHPFAFESGAGLYHTQQNKLTWAPELTLERLRWIDELKEWSANVIMPKFPGSVAEFTKRSDIGLIHPIADMNHQIYAEVKPYVNKYYPDFEVHDTDVSVNIILSDCNKSTGVRLLSESIGIALDDIAYIGDSSGDMPAMRIVNRAFAPSNARDVVKQIAEVIDEEATRATRIAYERIIESNRAMSNDR